MSKVMSNISNLSKSTFPVNERFYNLIKIFDHEFQLIFERRKVTYIFK
ncbi:MAG: hypothetical protein J07HN6_01136 [Halonotius sp. J07HN6]|nr:MAG: hypothetical protein J07HN6_01136 [Halonotius sp. J07HN6]